MLRKPIRTRTTPRGVAFRQLVIAVAACGMLGGCLADGTPLAEYRSRLIMYGLLYPDAGPADTSPADTSAVDAKPTDTLDAISTDVATADSVVADAGPPDVPAPVLEGDGGAGPGCPQIAAGTACSNGNGTQVLLDFHNGCSEALDVFWVSFTCSENKYHTIQPGMTQAQSTYAGHIWRLRNAQTGALVREINAPTGGGIAQVSVP